MQSIARTTLERFARAFCYDRKGYSLTELERLFVTYQSDAPSASSLIAATKSGYFVHCIGALKPETQRQLLYDLCDSPPPAKGPLPDANERLLLLHALVSADGVSPLGVDLSRVTLNGIRNQWFAAASRVLSSPSSAITAARALLETTCTDILHERRQPSDASGNLVRLFKLTRQALGLDTAPGAPQAVHQVISGLVQTVDGVSAISNLGGDRHGLADGGRMSDISLAALVVHACGTVSLFLAETHRLGVRTSGRDTHS